MIRLAFALVLSALLLAPSVGAEFQNASLSQVASAFASRPVVVVCRSEAEDDVLNWAWGYVHVPTAEQKQTVIVDEACRGAIAIATDSPDATDYMKAIGAAVITHESYHLRRIGGNQDEARTECRAMRHFDIALVKLGATQAVMDRLMPIMLVNSWRLRAITEGWADGSSWFGSTPTYHRPGCDMPRRYDRYLGFPPRDE